MQKFKISSLAVKMLLFLLFLSSCNKEDGVKNEAPKEEQQDSSSLRIESREYAPSLFGNNKIVPAHVARAIAERLNMTVPEEMVDGTTTTLRTVDSLFTISDSLGIPVMYIANYADDGFVVISADERHDPICAIAHQGRYESTEVPSMLLDWLDMTFENIQFTRSEEYSNSNYADKEWFRVMKDIEKEEYLVIGDCCPECPTYPECLTHPSIGCGEQGIICKGGGDDPCAPYTTIIKGPLMTTKWGQGCTYNEQCPDKNCDDVCFSNENAWTGCVATAMAQILRYWSHPCDQAYNFATMPNNSGNSEVQRMMRDIGDAVDMEYGCDGSGADGDKTDIAFKNDFCFGSADRDGYCSSSSQVVIQDINANRPVLLDGCSTRKRKFP